MRRISLCAWVGGAILAAACLHASAAGLGRLEVKSVLGEPLRAEVSVSANATEIRSLKARLASPSAYEAAGLVYTDIVSKLAVNLNKGDGEPVLTITSAGPINEPVVDLLLELTWSSGRVTREYTAFIDPPFIVAEREKRRVQEAQAEAADRGAETRAASVPEAPTPQPLPAETVADAPAAADAVDEQAAVAEVTAVMDDIQEPEEVQPPEMQPVETIGGTEATLFDARPAPSSGVAPPVAPAVPSSGGITGSPIGVIRGDTLSKLALANKPADVTLEQMLVVLFRNNPQAFSGNNMNRLRAGKIIRLPDPAEYRDVSPQQARKEVRVQYADWKAYRNRLAAAAMQQAPGAEQPAQQTAGGAVTPRVEDQAPAAAGTPSEVVKLSKGEPAAGAQGGAGQARVRELQEKLVASEKALGDANARVARLEKIIEDLQKLAEVKSEDLAQLQAQAQTAQGQPAPGQPAPGQPAPGQPEQPAPEAAQQPAAAGSEAPPAPEQAAGAAATQTPAPAAPGGEAAKAPTPAAPKPTRRPPAPPPPPPPSLLDQVMERPYLLAVPLVVLLLIGFGISRMRARKRESEAESEEVAPADSMMAGATAAPGTFSPADTDVGLASTRHGDGAEEVDPLEEAEIFLAYGRDAQAEELLKEAMQSHPRRYEVHAKLAEIYAKREDKEAFEKLARDVQQGTGGAGEIWDRVARLGYAMDPANPRYAAGKSGDGDAYADEPAGKSADISSTADRLDFDVGFDDGDEAGSAPDFDPSAASDHETPSVVDPEATMEGSFDMDDAPTMKFSAADAGLTATDLDLNPELPALDNEESGGPAGVDFDVDSAGEDASSQKKQTSDEGGGLDFNMDGFSLDSDGGDEDKTVSDDTSSDMPPLDLSGITLDLDGGSTTRTQASSSGKDEKWYEVQTKFDLAKAYQEMGDKDGAKEILQEVISEGDTEQKAAAESVLASLE